MAFYFITLGVLSTLSIISMIITRQVIRDKSKLTKSQQNIANTIQEFNNLDLIIQEYLGE